MELLAGICIGLIFGACIGAWIQDHIWRHHGHTGEYIDRGDDMYKVNKYE